MRSDLVVDPFPFFEGLIKSLQFPIISGQIRFAFQVPDLKAAMERLLAHGATLVHPPIITPWGNHNVRLQDPDGMQITLCQKLDNHDQ